MDIISKKRRSENMRAIRSTNTKLEVIVRRVVYKMGYRYRLHRKDLPGKPDIVFQKRQKVIFVHGCFWHQHQKADCKITRLPKSNSEYWKSKFDRNRKRDKKNLFTLKNSGWGVLTIWECEVKADKKLPDRIKSFLDS